MIADNDIIDCARMLLNNTRNIYLREEIEEFINKFEIFNTVFDKDDDIYIVLKKICKDGYDISDFELSEIPHECVWTFSNSKHEKWFDVYLNHFNDSEEYVTVGFVNSKSNTEDADSIESAIRQYVFYQDLIN